MSNKNLLLRVAAIAMVVSRRHFQSYSCPKSKHTFTQPQLMACLILKSYLKQTYRGVVDLLKAADSLRAALGLEQVPSFTTLQEFEKRSVNPELLDAILSQVLQLCQEGGHFMTRAKRSRKQYVKLSVAVACGSLLPVSMVLNMGPTPDLVEAPAVLWKAAGRCRPDFVFMDRGYDCEWIHRLCRDGQGAISYIPPVIRTSDGTIRTSHRARCQRYRPDNAGRRWHVESFFSGMKRSCGWNLRSRSPAALLNEAGLMALAYAIRR
jgi:hypothetical protein